MPPPEPAELPASVSALTVSVPSFRILLRRKCDEPPLIVKPESVAVTPRIDLEYFDRIATADRQPPWPGPSIAIPAGLVSDRTSVPIATA